jgi:succinoglycan biosynthesis transport protein ExoP
VNRRLVIFLAIFILVSGIGLGYTYSIVPTYLASARLQVDPGTDDKSHERAAFVANEAQALTSNEMLQSVLAAVSNKPAFWNFASVSRLRDTLAAVPVPGTNVIELQARGSDREQLPALLEHWSAAYLESRGARRTVDRELTIEDARKAVESLEARVAQKRGELDGLRRRYGIVSPEREDNEVAAEMKSLLTALNDARNKLVDSESRLSSAKAGIADGKPVYRAQDKATIAQLEQRLLESRQKLKDLEVNFTPQYLAMEPSVKALHANIAQVEKQIEDTRRTSQQALLNETTQDLLTAQKNVSRLEAQFGQRRNDALKFTSRFAEQKAQASELGQVEAQLAQARQRLAQLERSERAREPKYELLGRPSVAEKPVHPDYALYAAASAGGAFLAALLAVLLVEFLDPRPKPQTSFAQPIIQIAYPALAGDIAPRIIGPMAALPLRREALPAPEQATLRELSVAEVYALWDAATHDSRLALGALFSGLTLDELAGLKWNDVDLDGQRVTIVQPARRVQPITEPFAEQLKAKWQRRGDADIVAATGTGRAYSVDDLEGLIAAAAHDAGITQSQTISAETVRHTYISFLVKQGARLSELELVVGPVAPASFLHYRNLSHGAGVPFTELDRVFPTFRSA